MGVDAGIVFLPRFTTLVGATTFLTAPIDVSQQGGTQFQVWTSTIRVASGTGAFTMYMEESFDAESWSLGSSPTGAGTAFTVLPGTTLFSYDFRLRWFRLKVVLTGDAPIVACWAEGLLRGGGGSGMFGMDTAGRGPAGEVASRGLWRTAGGLTSWEGDPSAYPWSKYQDLLMSYSNPNIAQPLLPPGVRDRLLAFEKQLAVAQWQATHPGVPMPPMPPPGQGWFGGGQVPVAASGPVERLPGNP